MKVVIREASDMIAPIETDNLPRWTCQAYGVTMLTANAAAFCARRFAAANGKDGDERFALSHCRTCARGASEYELVIRKGEGIREKTKSSSQKGPKQQLRVNRVVLHQSAHIGRMRQKKLNAVTKNCHYSNRPDNKSLKSWQRKSRTKQN